MSSLEIVHTVLAHTEPLHHPRGDRLPLYVWALVGVAPHDDRQARARLQQLDERGIADLIWRFGEERGSRRIARAIVEAGIDEQRIDAAFAEEPSQQVGFGRPAADDDDVELHGFAFGGFSHGFPFFLMFDGGRHPRRDHRRARGPGRGGVSSASGAGARALRGGLRRQPRYERSVSASMGR